MLDFFQGLLALFLALNWDRLVKGLQFGQVLLYRVSGTQDDDKRWLELLSQLGVAELDRKSVV